MSRTLEEILNTPVEFKEGQRVFSLREFIFINIIHIKHEADYPIRALKENNSRILYTIEGKYDPNRSYRELLTEQEAYELFPSLKPKVYEYQVIFKNRRTNSYYLTESWFTDKPSSSENSEFIELYQPSKRERKS